MSTSDAERALAAVAAAAASSTSQPDARKVALFSSLCDYLLNRGDSIVLYDGICLVCNRFIQFVADRDPAQRIHFAPLQSELGQWIIKQKRIPPMDSMLLIAPATAAGDTTQSGAGALDAASWFCRTNAALRILLSLHPRWFWSLLWLLLLIPAILRDPFYALFAMLRYRLFGVIAEGDAGGASCRMITKAERPRYLEYVVKDREKERNKREKEAAAKETATATSAAAASSAPATGSLLDAQASAEIRAQTDRELELQHGHTHSPLLRPTASPSTSSPNQAPEEIAPLQASASAHADDRIKQRKTKGVSGE